jgi:hypothetical protein
MQKHYSVEKVLSLLPDQILDDIAFETKVDYSVKKLSGKIILKLFIYSLLSSSRTSQRILSHIYQSPRFRSLFHTKQKIQFSAISMRLGNIKTEYFKKIFITLASKNNDGFLKLGKHRLNIEKLDSTFITLSSKLLSIGMNMGEGKKHIKFGVVLGNQIPLDVKVFTENKDISDNTTFISQLQRKSRNSLDITVFDRGLQKIDHFLILQKENILFVSRLREAQSIIIKNEKIIKEESDTLEDITDCDFMFEKDLDATFRVIRAKKKDTGEVIRFVTNITTLSAIEITELYKSRWEIEVFFKFIKQELNFSHLLSRNANGIEAVLYLTMITATLLIIYKKKNTLTNWVIIKMMFFEEMEESIMKTWNTEIYQVLNDPVSLKNDLLTREKRDFEQ